MGGLGCDNMTVILVCLLNGQSYEDLVERCSKPQQKDILEKSDQVAPTTETDEEESTKLLSNNLPNGVDEQNAGTTVKEEVDSGKETMEGIELT